MSETAAVTSRPNFVPFKKIASPTAVAAANRKIMILDDVTVRLPMLKLNVPKGGGNVLIFTPN